MRAAAPPPPSPPLPNLLVALLAAAAPRFRRAAGAVLTGSEGGERKGYRRERGGSCFSLPAVRLSLYALRA